MSAPRGTNWHLAAHDLQWRWWDDQLIVYHQASGDTHLLNRLAGEVLCHLHEDPSDAAALVDRVALQLMTPADQREELLEQVGRLLHQLEELGLVEAVPS